ncbi:MAG: hypothetical protein GXZ08_08060 [Tissierellia bacterium]|nr:hypothetical protein [Tissierellia bacterium]
MIKKIIRKISFIALLYLIFFIASTVVYPKIEINKIVAASDKNLNLENYYSDALGPDEATVIAGTTDGLSARVELIENAKSSIDLAYYIIDNDTSGDIFLGKLLEAAERGVKIRIIVNGASTKWTNNDRYRTVALVSNENIDLKLYGNHNLLTPWHLNNVLHEKIMIVDNEYFMSSGRNVSDRFILNDQHRMLTYDLDILTHLTNVENITDSVISQANSHFDELWNSSYSRLTVDIDKISPEQKSSSKDELYSKYISAWNVYGSSLNPNIIESLNFYPTNRVSLVTNPTDNIVKTPSCWNTMTSFMNFSDNIAILQTPYPAITKEMKSFMDIEHLQSINYEVQTNSVAASPNIPAFSNYLNKKNAQLDYSNIYEYQGPGSIHAKALIIDDDISMLGSCNADSRSAFLSSENMVIVNGAEFNIHMNEVLEVFRNSSLKAVGKYEYEASKTVSEEQIPILKNLIFKIASIITMPFDHLI